MVAKRKRIGIIYSYWENWIGGTYYIENLIKALNQLEDCKKPFLKIICKNKNNLARVYSLNYPYLKGVILNRNYFIRSINKAAHLLLGARIIDKYHLSNLDALFPVLPITPAARFHLVPSSKKIFWIPDFQHHYLPEYFSAEEIAIRNEKYQNIADSNAMLVLSSQAALEDFKNFYTPYKCNLTVLNFAVSHPKIENDKWPDIKSLYHLPDKFFFITNQFWKHKNHSVVLKALKILVERGGAVNFVFSGKEEDYRNPDYVPALKTYVRDNRLSAYCQFLGFIPREHQLLIMKNAKAVIQPSLFEGWSTVVEDAKAIGKHVIASDIKTHREQLGKYGLYFDPNDEFTLAQVIIESSAFEKKVDYNYQNKIKCFADDFIQILDII